MKNLIQSTLAKIKQEHIAPEPRWKFLARQFGVWMALGLIVLLGALSVSVVYFLLTQLDWELPGMMHQNIFFYGLGVFPYFWLFLLGIFSVVAFWGIRKTENGYRFSWFKIIFLLVGGILLTGTVLSFIGVNKRFNGSMMRSVPYYANHTITKEKQWMQPELGFLAGTIRNIEANTIALEDLNGQAWKVQINNQTLVRPSADVSVGQMIKLIGFQKDGQNFSATEIRPWVGRGMMGSGQGRGMMGQ